jgi:hypothetical protein
MANYGGPDPYAFRELLAAVKSQGDAMASGIDKLGEAASDGIAAYRKRKEEQGIDMTAEATAAGLDWEGKAEGKKVSLFDVKRMGFAERQALLSLAKSRREAKGYEDAENYEFMHAHAMGVAAPDAKSGMVIAPLGIYDAIKSHGVSTFEYTPLDLPSQSGESPAVPGSTKTPALPGVSKLPKNRGSVRNQSGGDAVVKFGREFVDRLLNMGGL